MTPDAITSMSEVVTTKEIAYEAPVVAEFVDYLRWLADQDTSYKMSMADLWMLWYEGVRRCIPWTTVCEDLGLPVRDDWN